MRNQLKGLFFFFSTSKGIVEGRTYHVQELMSVNRYTVA